MKKYTVLVLSLLLLTTISCGGDSSSSSSSPAPQEEEETPTPEPEPTPDPPTGGTTAKCYVQEPVDSPYTLAYLINKTGSEYSYSTCSGTMESCMAKGPLTRFTEGTGEEAVSCFTSGSTLDFQTCVKEQKDFVNTSFGKLVGMNAIREGDIAFYLLSEEKVLKLMLPVPVTCTYFHDASGDAELDAVFASNINKLAERGWAQVSTNGIYLLNLGVATCEGEDCVQLSVDKLPIPESRLYEKSRKGLEMKTQKGQSLIDNLPNCKDFKRIYDSK